MAAEEKSRGTLATIVATAAVTLAVGMTVAAVGGYLAPAGGDPVEEVVPLSPPISSTEQGSTSSIVLVPITRAVAPQTVPARPDAGLLAAYEPAASPGDEDDDDDRRRDHKYRDRDHERHKDRKHHKHDDDDEDDDDDD